MRDRVLCFPVLGTFGEVWGSGGGLEASGKKKAVGLHSETVQAGW